jgi:CRISP-associated protein Cas1
LLDEADRLYLRRRSKYQRPGAIVLAGHGIRLAVEAERLVVQQGRTHWPMTPAALRFLPGAIDLPERIVIAGGSGVVTLDALEWLAGQSVALVSLDWQGRSAAICSPSGYAAHPVIARAQATAASSGRGLDLSINLVKTKMAGYLAVLNGLAPISPEQTRSLATIESAMAGLSRNPPLSIPELRGVEGKAGFAYRTALQPVPIRWRAGRRGTAVIPADWQAMPPRTSTARGKNYNARHPINALLNYAYAVLESAVRAAIVVEGLDPTIGYLHADPRHSDRDTGAHAFVLDLMEPLRPCADAAVLAIISEHTFARDDFHVTTEGACRLNPQLARYIAAKVLASEQSGPGRPQRPRGRSGSDIFSYLDPNPAQSAKARNVHEAARIVAKTAIREIAKEPTRRRRT